MSSVDHCEPAIYHIQYEYHFTLISSEKLLRIFFLRFEVILKLENEFVCCNIFHSILLCRLEPAHIVDL